MSEKLLTEHEAQLRKRNAAIQAEFDRLRAENPDASDWRIMGVLSGRYKVSTMTIRNVVRK